MTTGKRWGAISLLLLAAVFAAADDRSAEALYLKGYAAYEDGNYRAAADCFESAEIEADSPVLKSNSVIAKIAAWRMCDMPFREFTAIETLLTQYPEYIQNYTELVEREFALGDAYYNGSREPAYWSLRWIPWLVDGDRSIEIFKKALERAPFAPSAARARLRLAYLYGRENKPKEAVEQLRILIQEYPETDECRMAHLALAEELCILAERGDGDGSFNLEGREVLENYLKRYPNSTEDAWARRTLLKLRDIQAARLHNLAKFYERQGRTQVAERYLAEVLRDYPDTETATASEEMLIELDRNFVPDDFREEVSPRYPAYRAYTLPTEAKKLLIAPENSDRRFLQPIYDLGQGDQLPPKEESSKQ